MLNINTKIESELLQKCIELRREFIKYPTIGQAMKAVEQLSQEMKLALFIGLSITSIEELAQKENNIFESPEQTIKRIKNEIN